MKLETTKERILAAAAKCSTAKQTLQTLFPEAFEEDKSVKIMAGELYHTQGGDWLLQRRSKSNYSEKSFLLNDYRYNWEIKKDTQGALCLIPTKK